MSVRDAIRSAIAAVFKNEALMGAAGAAAAVSHVPVLLWAAQAIGAGYVTIAGAATFNGNQANIAVQSGDALVVCFSGLAGADQGAPTIAGATLVKQTAAYVPWSSNSLPYGGYYLASSPTTGTQTVTAPTVAGGNDGLIAVWSVPNMPATVTVQTATQLLQATAGKTITLTTAGNVSVGGIAFGYRSHENSVGSTDTLTPPAGWTSDAQYLNGASNLPTDWSHLIIASGGGAPLSATWTSVDNAITGTSGAILVLNPT